MASNLLYIKCPACDGNGSRTFTDEEEFNSVMAMPPPFCIVCDGVGFMESGLHEGQVDKMEEKRKEFESALKFIHDMAYEDLRTAHETTSTWTIEAVAAKALGLSDAQRDLGVTADDKLVELMTHVAQKCDAEVAEMWKTWKVTVSPDAKERLIDEHGLNEDHFVEVGSDYQQCPRCKSYSLHVEYETHDELHWEISDCLNCEYHHYGQDTRELGDVEIVPATLEEVAQYEIEYQESLTRDKTLSLLIGKRMSDLSQVKRSVVMANFELDYCMVCDVVQWADNANCMCCEKDSEV